MSDLFSNIAHQIQDIYEKYDGNTDAATKIMSENPEINEKLTLLGEAGIQIAHGFIPPELVTNGIINEDAVKQYIVTTREIVDPDFGKFGGHDWLMGLNKDSSTDIKLTNEEILNLSPNIHAETLNKTVELSDKSFVKDSDGNFIHSVEKFEGDSFRFEMDGKSYTGLDLYRVKLEMTDGKNGYLLFTADNTGKFQLNLDALLNGRDLSDPKSQNLSCDGPGVERYLPSLDITTKWEKLPSESEDAFKDRIDDFKTRYEEAASKSYDNFYERIADSDSIRQGNIADRKAEAQESADKDFVYMDTASTYRNILKAEVIRASDKLKNLIAGEGGFNDIVKNKEGDWQERKEAVIKEIASSAQDVFVKSLERTSCTDNIKPLNDYRSYSNVTVYDLTGPTENGKPMFENWGKEETVPQMMEAWKGMVDDRNSQKHDLTSDVNPMRYDEAATYEKIFNERDGWQPLSARDKIVTIVSHLSVRTTPVFTPPSTQILPKQITYVKEVCVPYIKEAVEKYNADKEPDMQVSFNEEKGVLEGNKDSIKELTDPDSEFGKDQMALEEFIAFPFTMDEKDEKQKVDMSEEDKGEVRSVVTFTKDLVLEGKSIDGYSAKDLLENNRMEESEEDSPTSDNDDYINNQTEGTSTQDEDETEKEFDSQDDEDGADFYPITAPIVKEDGTAIQSRAGGMIGKTTPTGRAMMFGVALAQIGMFGPFGLLALGLAIGTTVEATVAKNKAQKESADLELVKQDGTLIKYIKNPTEKVMLTAVNQNPVAILNIVAPTEKTMIRAFAKDGTLAAKVDSGVLTEKAMISAVTNSPDTVKDLSQDKVTKNVSEAAETARDRQVGTVTKDVENIKNFNNPCVEAKQIVVDKRPDLAVKYLDGKLTDDQQVSIVSKNPKLATDMKVVSQLAQSKLISMDSENYKLIKNPSHQTKMELVSQNGLDIRMIARPDEGIMRAAIRENPNAVTGIKNPPESIVKEALGRNGMIAERLDKSVLTKDALIAAVKNAPDIENSANIDKSLITDDVKNAAKEARTQQCASVAKDPSSIADMNNPSKAARTLAIEKDPDAAAKEIKNPTKEEKLAIVEKSPSSAVHFEKQGQTVQSKLAENIDNYRFIKEPTLQTKVEYVERFPEKIKDVFGDNPPKSTVKSIVMNDPSNLKYIDKPDRDLIEGAINKDAKAVALNVKPGVLGEDHKIMIAGKAGAMIGTVAMKEGGLPEHAVRVAMTGQARISGKTALNIVFSGLTPEQCKTAIDNDPKATEKIIREAVRYDPSAISAVRDTELRANLINENPPLIVALNENGITPTESEIKSVAWKLDPEDESRLGYDVKQQLEEVKDTIVESVCGSSEEIPVDDGDERPMPESIPFEEEDALNYGYFTDEENSYEKKETVPEKQIMDEGTSADKGNTANNEQSIVENVPADEEDPIGDEQPTEKNDFNNSSLVEGNEQTDSQVITKKEDDAAVDIAGSVAGTPVTKPEEESENPLPEVEADNKSSTMSKEDGMESEDVAEDTVSDAQRDALESETESEARSAMERQSEENNTPESTPSNDGENTEVDVSDSLPTTEDFYNAATSYEDKDSLNDFISNLSEKFSDLDENETVAGFNDVLDSLHDMVDMFLNNSNGMDDQTFALAFQDICDAASQIFNDNGIVNGETDKPYDTSDIMDITMDSLKEDHQGDDATLDRLNGLQDIIDENTPVMQEDVSAPEAVEAQTASDAEIDTATKTAIDEAATNTGEQDFITQDKLNDLAKNMMAGGVDAPDSAKEVATNTADELIQRDWDVDVTS